MRRIVSLKKIHNHNLLMNTIIFQQWLWESFNKKKHVKLFRHEFPESLSESFPTVFLKKLSHTGKGILFIILWTAWQSEQQTTRTDKWCPSWWRISGRLTDNFQANQGSGKPLLPGEVLFKIWHERSRIENNSLWHPNSLFFFNYILMNYDYSMIHLKVWFSFPPVICLILISMLSCLYLYLALCW